MSPYDPGAIVPSLLTGCYRESKLSVKPRHVIPFLPTVKNIVLRWADMELFEWLAALMGSEGIYEGICRCPCHRFQIGHTEGGENTTTKSFLR